MTKETAIDILESQKNEHYKEEINEALDMAISALKGGWIPVNSIEDVPKNGKVWVTLKLPFIDTPCVEVFVWIPTEKAWAFVEDFSVVSPLTIKCVTAYMPYVEPEPYKKGE